MQGDVESILLTEAQISRRVEELGREIARFYQDSQDGIVIVPILSGSIVFLADLIRKLPIRMRIGMAIASSYVGTTIRPEGARLLARLLPRIKDREVLIVDDILDTGGTLRLVQQNIAEGEPRRICTAVLLRKPGKAPPDVAVDFVGFDIEDRFVVGYGLDYNDLYRNLPYIGVLRPELYED